MRPADRGATAWSVVSATAAPIVLVVGWLIAAAVQPSGYHARAETISALAAHGAAHRLVMTLAFTALGLCHLTTAAGSVGLGGTARIVLAGAGAATLGVAAAPEPAHGSSAVHVAFATTSIVALCLWPMLARVDRVPRGAFVATATLLVALAWLGLQTRDGADLGIAERVVTGLQAVWPLVVVLALRRHAGDESRAARIDR